MTETNLSYADVVKGKFNGLNEWLEPILPKMQVFVNQSKSRYQRQKTPVEHNAESDRDRNSLETGGKNSSKRNWDVGIYRPEKNTKFVNTTLILKNLPPNCTSSRELLEIFEECGPIKFINILKDEDGSCKGLAFIRFEKKEGSDKGLDLDGFYYEDRKIFVEYARDRRE